MMTNPDRDSLVPSVQIWLVAAGHLLLAALGYFSGSQNSGFGWLACLAVLANGVVLAVAGFRIREDRMPWRRVILVASCWAVPTAVCLVILEIAKESIPNVLQAVGMSCAVTHIVSGVVLRSWRVLSLTFVIFWSVYFAAMIACGILVTLWYVVTGTPSGISH